MITSLSGRLVFFYRLNPVVGLVESYRDILVYSRWPEPMTLAGSAVTSLGLFIVGFLVFKRLEPRFADVI
jgi:ABC-type polysaccharide/polyol phosphate export permease